jgi:hypothetical protein
MRVGNAYGLDGGCAGTQHQWPNVDGHDGWELCIVAALSMEPR